MTPPIVTPGRARVVLAIAVLAAVGCGEVDDPEANVSTPAPEADLTVGAHDIDFDSDEYRLAPGEQPVAYLQVDAGPHPSRGFPSPRPAAVRGRVVMTRPVPPNKEHQP